MISLRPVIPPQPDDGRHPAMPIEPSPETAIARWLSLGVTSRTHPVLRNAYQIFFEPLGIEASWLEAEPFSALESGSGEWWLREARWNPARLAKGHPAAGDFEFLLADPGRFRVDAEPQGLLSIFPSCDQAWTAVRHSLRAGQDAGAFIHLAAGLILLGDPAARLFAAGDDDAFCASVQARLAKVPPGAGGERAENTVGTAVCRSENESAAAGSPL
jgi:hypothetical protein